MSVDVSIRRALASGSLDVEFSARAGRTAILGASGCGKTMTLKCVAGTERPDSGLVSIDGRAVFDSSRGVNERPQERRCGFLFQNYALFPNMTVRENVRIVARERVRGTGSSLSAADASADGMLERLSLAPFADQRPARLSGGQQQRVALARILVSDPRAILLDEPLSALDAFLRASVERELVSILSGFPGSVLLVTHNVDEAFRLCDDILIMESGRISQSGTKERVFSRPATVGAARLTGCENVARAERAGAKRVAVPSWGLILETEEFVPDGLTHVGVRARHVREARDGDECNCLDFSLRARAASAFSREWSAIALTAAGVAGGDRERRDGLTVTGGGWPDASARSRLCVPKESLLLFAE